MSVSDLVAYRTRFEKLIERGAQASATLPAGRFEAVVYRSRADGAEHLALVHGTIGDGEDVPVHVHRACLLGDLLGSGVCGCAAHLRSALTAVAGAGRGIVLHLRSSLPGADCCREPHHILAVEILRDLGVRRPRLLDGDSGSPYAVRNG